MSRLCCICNTSNPCLTLFSFPTQNARSTEWCRLLNINLSQKVTSLRICEKHFSPNQFTSAQRVCLRKNAVPISLVPPRQYQKILPAPTLTFLTLPLGTTSHQQQQQPLQPISVPVRSQQSTFAPIAIAPKPNAVYSVISSPQVPVASAGSSLYQPVLLQTSLVSNSTLCNALVGRGGAAKACSRPSHSDCTCVLCANSSSAKLSVPSNSEVQSPNPPQPAVVENTNAPNLAETLQSVLNYVRIMNGNSLPEEIAKLVSPLNLPQPKEPAADDVNIGLGSVESLNSPASVSEPYSDDYEPQSPAQFKLVDVSTILEKGQDHGLTQSQSQKCPYCDQEFDSVEELSKHSLIHCLVPLTRIRIPDKCLQENRTTRACRDSTARARTKLMSMKQRCKQVGAFAGTSNSSDSLARTNSNLIGISNDDLSSAHRDAPDDPKVEVKSSVLWNSPVSNQWLNNPDPLSTAGLFFLVDTSTMLPVAQDGAVLTSQSHNCDYCKKKFYSVEELRKHTRTHCLPARQARRKLLALKKESKAQAQRLKAQAQQLKITQYPCPVCKQDFTGPKLMEHVREQHPGTGTSVFTCETCGKGFNGVSNYREHVKYLHSTVIKQILCSICGQTFKRPRCLKMHMQTVHTRSKNYKCSYCSYAGASSRNLAQHLDLHFRRNLKQCPHCGCLIRRTYLKTHIECVHEGKRFKCKFCDFLSQSANKIREHVLLKHPDVPESVTKVITDCSSVIYVDPTDGQTRRSVGLKRKRNDDYNYQIIPVDKDGPVSEDTGLVAVRLVCTICNNYPFKKRDLWKSHMLKHERDPNYRITPRRKVFVIGQDNNIPSTEKPNSDPNLCRQETEPGNISTTNTDFTSARVKVPNRSWSRAGQLKQNTCPVCSQEFTVQKQLSDHVLEQHPGSSAFICDTCGHGSKTPKGFHRHVQGRHSATNKQLSCPICGKTFPARQNLDKHIEGVHTRSGNYKCSYCSFVGHTAQSLTQHTRRHFNKKKTQCPHCHCFLTCSNNLKRHIECVHEGKRFKCKFCNTKKWTASYIREHILLMHSDLPESVTTAADCFTVIHIQPTGRQTAKSDGQRRKRKRNDGIHAVDEEGSLDQKTSAVSNAPVCHICNNHPFSRREFWKAHMAKHERDPNYRISKWRPVALIEQAPLIPSTEHPNSDPDLCSQQTEMVNIANSDEC